MLYDKYHEKSSRRLIMLEIHKKIVIDENKKPIAVQIPKGI